MGNVTKGEWCSCGVKDLGDRVYQINYCPKHKAAPDMYVALKNLLKVSRSGAFPSIRDIGKSEDALAKAEDK